MQNHLHSTGGNDVALYILIMFTIQGLQAVVKDLLTQIEPLKDDIDLIAGIDAAGFTLGTTYYITDAS